MTTDREQHELAAKAAGLAITWKEGHCKGGPFAAAFIGDQSWRPKENDGDAFRLAVMLRLGVNITSGLKWTSITYFRVSKMPTVVEDHGDDPLAATRLAIFRAAVEIGRSLS
jgi:hypothetical protein